MYSRPCGIYINILTLEHLKDSKTPAFDESNRDLYPYLSELHKLGIEVVVVSGEQRVKTF